MKTVWVSARIKEMVDSIEREIFEYMVTHDWVSIDDILKDTTKEASDLIFKAHAKRIRDEKQQVTR